MTKFLKQKYLPPEHWQIKFGELADKLRSKKEERVSVNVWKVFYLNILVAKLLYSSQYLFVSSYLGNGINLAANVWVIFLENIAITIRIYSAIQPVLMS